MFPPSNQIQTELGIKAIKISERTNSIQLAFVRSSIHRYIEYPPIKQNNFAQVQFNLLLIDLLDFVFHMPKCTHRTRTNTKPMSV